MLEPTPNDPTGKVRDVATKALHFILDEVGDALDQVRTRLRAEREAGIQAHNVLDEIADILTTPPGDDPLTVIHEIEDRLGVDHYDWPSCGRWTRHPIDDD